MEKVWQPIIKYLKENKKLNLISPRSNTQSFEIITIEDDYITIKFESGTPLKLEKSRFVSAYNMLKNNQGNWVKIGATRIDSKPNTLEGKVKEDFDGNMRGISTAPWVATILVRVFKNIEFNDQAINQAVRMV